MTQAVVTVGKMPKGGRIINVGTVTSKMQLDSYAVYAAAKAAQDALTSAWAGEVCYMSISKRMPSFFYIFRELTGRRCSWDSPTALQLTRWHLVHLSRT